MSLTGDTFDFQQGNVVTSSAQIVDPGATVGDVLTVQADKSIAAAPGGGSQPVTCLLARDANFDIRTVGNYDVLWDALYDNFWDLNPLVAIPAGLGLTFAFDGSSSLVVPTEPGVWSFSYAGERGGDPGWAGNFTSTILRVPWLQQLDGVGAANGTPYLAGALATPLPTGAQLAHQVATTTNGASNPYTCDQVYLSIVRHA